MLVLSSLREYVVKELSMSTKRLWAWESEIFWYAAATKALRRLVGKKV